MTQQDPSAAEVSSTKSRTPEQKAKWAAYIRNYRKNRRIREKLAAGQIIALEATSSEVATPVSTEGESSIPDASTQAGNA